MIVLLLLLILSGCTAGPLDKGITYLHITPINQDPYLAYVYPGEKLNCNLPNCTITYRSLDRDFNLHFLGEIGVRGKLDIDIKNANLRLQSVAKDWETQGIYNVMNKPVQDGIALDTYCIVGLLTNNSAMAQKVSDVRTGGHWMSENFYTGEEHFRHLADESWCIRLLFKTGTGDQYLPQEVEDMLEETEILLSSKASVIAKSTGTLHTVYVLYDIKDLNPLVYGGLLQKYQDYVFNTTTELSEDTITLANILDCLISTGYPKAKLMLIANMITERQQTDGSWLPDTTSKTSMAKIFTTYRAVGALTKMKK